MNEYLLVKLLHFYNSTKTNGVFNVIVKDICQFITFSSELMLPKMTLNLLAVAFELDLESPQFLHSLNTEKNKHESLVNVIKAFTTLTFLDRY